ncbi:hypothetical protein BKA69DRAFT_1077001 [Paraphysoderma sedebokerense]|nr:hypothetical protein BKA69DRAFT_1077001 [Paraphysoderma sedebokerense]
MADFGFDFSESESATTNSGSSEEAGEVEQFVQPSSEIIYIPDHYVPIDQIEFLRPAEKIRQYGKAKVLTHRVYITRHLDSILPRITRQSTFNSVLPILNKLVTDNDTAVREAFAKGLKRLLLAYGEIKSSHIPLTKSTDSLPSLVEQMRLESVSSPQPSATSQVYTTYLPAHFLTSLVLPLLMDSTPSVQREAKEQLLSAVSEEPGDAICEAGE